MLVGVAIALAGLGLMLALRWGDPDGGSTPLGASEVPSVATPTRPLDERSGAEGPPAATGEGNSATVSGGGRVATATVSAGTVRQPTPLSAADPTALRDVSGIGLFTVRPGSNVAPYIIEGPAATVEEILERGLRLAGASPVHIAIRGTAASSSVRCEWRGIARTPEQREQAIRFWLRLDTDEEIPDAAFLEALFTATMDTLDPANRETAKSNFLVIARGGLSAEYLFLTCYADYAASEYLLGSGARTLTVAYDRMGEARSYELYLREYDTGLFGEEPPMPRGEYESLLLEIVVGAERSLAERIGGYESVMFLAPMGAHNAIAVEAWQVVAQWDVQVDGDGTVNAVRYGTPEYDPEYTQPYTGLVSRVATSTASDAFADSRITSTEGLTRYYRDIGAYDDITPGDGSTATFTPAQPPAMPTCAGAPASSGAGAGPGLIRDCTVLLDSMATLAGTATLDWNASTTISSWEGVSLNASSTRVTGLDLDNESLDGRIPAALGDLSALETLDLSDNALSGAIPIELGRLWDLRELRLLGNSFTGCIPLELRSVPTNDLSSLGLPYCEPPAPENLNSATSSASSIALSWDAVAGAARFRVEHRSATSTEWTVHDDTITVTRHTVDGLACGIGYRLRVRSYGDGVTYETVWSLPSGVVSETTGDCVPPVFDQPVYSFSVPEDAATSTVVGTVRATAPGNMVTYTITLGNEDGAFAMGESSGEIAVAGGLDHETVPSYSLTVEASTERSGTTTAMVEIAVTDVLDVAPPAPSGLSVSLADGTFTIGWDAVAGAALYEAQHRVAGSGAGWMVVGTTTATLLTYIPEEELVCGTTYEFRVRAYGDGTAYVSDWGEPSTPESVVYDSTYDACTEPPEFATSTYAFAVPEDAPTGRLVGTVSAMDPDQGDTVMYEILAGNEGGAFVMGERSGAIEVAGALDYETTPSYSLTVSAGDGRGGTATTTVGISVTNVIELPGVPQNLRATMEGPWVRLDWDAPSDPTVTGYQVLRRRPQEGEQSLLVHEEDTGSTDTFYIDMRVAPETMYAYRVKAINSDGVGLQSNFANITTGALSAPPAPSGLAASASEEVFAVTWDALGGAALYEVEHRIAGGGQSYATTTPDTMLTISPEGGVACGTTYEFKVRAYGDGTLLAADWGEYSEPATVMTDPCNRAPEFGGPYSFSIPENSATSTPVVTVLATDRDQGDTVTYTITSGNEAGRFTIGESSGEITVAGSLDHEAVSSYRLTVEASDGRGGTATTTVEVAVIDVAEDPSPAPQGLGVTLTGDAFSISWSAVSGAALYEVQQRIAGSGEDWAGVATTTATVLPYSPAGGPECGTTYEFRVRAYGDGTTYVADWGQPSEPEPYMTEACNRVPKFRPPSYTLTIPENAGTSTPVGTVTATDPDGDTVSYSITAGNGAGRFAIATSTGAITLTGTVDPDVVAFYALTVAASDGVAGASTAAVGVAVLLDECSNGTVVPRPRNNPRLVRDCSMLLAARDTLAGDASLDWSADTDINDWQGLKVERGDSPYVRVLLLTGMGLTGRIPPALGGVADLRRIDLDDNLLTGEIPRELGSLSDMVLIYLHTNRLTGSIPPELGALSNLQALFLSDNMLTGGIPAELGKLRNLRELTIEDNSLTGGIPPALGDLTRLVALYLSENMLTGGIPAELGNLRNLKFLVLERNSLGGEIPSELGDLTRLVAVYLRNNGLTGSIPAGWGDLSNLAHLYLSSGNDLTGCIPSGLRDVADNDLAGLGLDYCS